MCEFDKNLKSVDLKYCIEARASLIQNLNFSELE